jgi:F0F1-type ATP synthase membrane subunit b/b'
MRKHSLERFNAELNNQRDQFNAQNQLAIAQANAVWRRELATADTAAVNRANELNAAAVLDVSTTAYNNLWQYYADTMEWAWTSAENNAERLTQMAVAELDAKVRKDLGQLKVDADESQAIGGFITDVFMSPLSGTLLGGIF